nr:sentrin-specific protease 2-like [Lytechinus pictus]
MLLYEYVTSEGSDQCYSSSSRVPSQGARGTKFQEENKQQFRHTQTKTGLKKGRKAESSTGKDDIIERKLPKEDEEQSSHTQTKTGIKKGRESESSTWKNDIMETKLPKEDEEQSRHTQTKRGLKKARKAEMSTLNDDIIEAIKVTCKRCPNDVMAQINKVAVCYRDMATLLRENWLNDVTINAYLELIHLKSRTDGRAAKIYPFLSQWYQFVTLKGATLMERWARNTDLASYEWLLFPVNTNAHWFLIGFQPKSKTIESFDSLHGENELDMELAIDVFYKEDF